MRLGVFAGAGSGQLKTDFGLQKVGSDYVFGGGYGRFDQHSYYVDGDNTVNTVLLGQTLAFTTPGRANVYGGGAGLTLDWRAKAGTSLFSTAEGTLMNDHSASIAAKGGMRVGF